MPPADADLPQVEPIISDEEFKDAIPALDTQDDSELDAPLESIEEFERRMDSEEAEGVDEALSQALPPLEQFELAPVDLAGAADEGDGAQVAYKLELNGLEEADRQTGVNLRGMFNGLSALRDGKGKAANAAMISARLDDDSELLRTILASEGWYDPVLNTRIELPDDGEAGPILAIMDVVPGKRFSFSDIVIEAQETVPPGLIDENLALQVGEPIIAERVQGAEAQVAVALPEQGYPFAEVGQRSILLDRKTGEGIYLLPVDPGPRARFGGFATEGDLAFGTRHLDVLARFERGDLYDSRKIDDLRKALIATSLFSTVAVEPKRTGEGAGDDTEYVTINVRQDAGPPRTIAASAGYGTGEGFRLEGSWTHRNLFPPEGALIVRGLAGTSEQGAGLTFRRSNAGKRDRTFELVAEGLHSDFQAYSAYTGRLAAQMRYSSTPIWQKKFTYAVGIELLATAEKDWDFDLGRRDRRTYYVAGVNGLAGLDLTDDLLDPTRGFRLSASVKPEASLDGGSHIYVRSQIDASAYYPAGDSFVVAGRVRLGSIQGTGRDRIAPSRRYYAGGGGSVRGFGYQQLGPLDPSGDPIGGRSLNEASAELRYRWGDFGVVGFVDVGQSYADTMPQFSDLRFGAGIGARYYTNFGPLRIDLATPIDRRTGEDRINIYVSIGQAF